MNFQTNDNHHWVFEKNLGHGKYAYTYKYSLDGKPVTVKVSRVSERQRDYDSFRIEVDILKKLSAGRVVSQVPKYQYSREMFSNDRLFNQLTHSRSTSSHIFSGLLAYDYVPGETLNKIIESNDISFKPNFDLLANLLEQMLSIITEIHSLKIYHRDIKPANIMYTPETGEFTLLDFGLSCLGDNFRGLSGSPAFILPKLLIGDIPLSEAATRASDYYALGVTAYEYANSRKPFKLREKDGKFKYSNFAGWLNLEDAPEWLKEKIKKLIFQSELL